MPPGTCGGARETRVRPAGGSGVKEGNVFYFEERVAGRLLKKEVVFTRVVPSHHIELAPTFRLLKLYLPRLLFRIGQEPDGCLFVAEIHLRMGPLATKLNEKQSEPAREGHDGETCPDMPWRVGRSVGGPVGPQPARLHQSPRRGANPALQEVHRP